MPPSISAGDAGELIAAAWHLGSPHPPGYPVYTLLSKLSTFLSFGNIAFRVNLLSLLFATFACAMPVPITGLIVSIYPRLKPLDLSNVVISSSLSSLIFAAFLSGLAIDYGMNTLKSVDPGSTYLANVDSKLFALFYLQVVEGHREDVEIVPVDFISQNWYYKQDYSWGTRQNIPDLITGDKIFTASIDEAKLISNGNFFSSEISLRQGDRKERGRRRSMAILCT